MSGMKEIVLICIQSPLSVISVRTSANRIIGFVFLAVAAVIWPQLYCYINNSDAFQYFQLARLYGSGQWAAAVNGYWSPLLPWLMAPMLLAGLASIVAFKLLQVFLAYLALNRWQRIIDRTIPAHPMLVLLKVVAIPFLLSYAFLTATSDLLFFTLTMSLLEKMIAGPLWTRTDRFAVKFGLLGGLLYLSKAFGLPMFLILFLASLWHHRKVGYQIVWTKAAKTLLVFLFICGGWSTIISYHYHHFTVSEAARFNNTREVAPLPGQIMRLPVLTGGLTKPVSSTAISAWEEPMEAVHLTPLHPLENNSDALHLLGVIERNLQSIWYFDFRRQLGWVFLLVLLVGLFFQRAKMDIRDPSFFYPMLFLVLFYGGYSLILFHTRYTWICTWMMLLLIGVILRAFIGKNSIQSLVFLGLLITVVVAVKRPIKELLFAEDRDMGVRELSAALMHPFRTLDTTYQDDRLVYDAAKQLHEKNLLSRSVASRNSESKFRHRYSSSLQVAFENEVQYFGQMESAGVSEKQQLQEMDINYLLVWDDNDTLWNGERPIFISGPLRVFPVR